MMVAQVFQSCTDIWGLDVSLESVQVFFPLQLGDSFRIAQGKNDTLSLRTAEGRRLAAASLHNVVSTNQSNQLHIPFLSLWDKMAFYASGAEMYAHMSSVLFHQEVFQVLHQVAWNENMVLAQLTERSWQSTMLAMDAALQLALVWTKQRSGIASLPTSIEKIEKYTDTPVVAIVLEGKKSKDVSALTDAYLLDDNDNIVMKIQGISTYMVGENE
jgi:hypothetical protein